MTASLIQSVLDSVSVDGMRDHISALEGIRHPAVDPDALERAADYILAALQELGYGISRHSFLEGGREYQNILAMQPGLRFPERRVIVLAHYDTVADSPGADDNASGVAALLEMAKVLKPLQFERTVQFIAVNLEERQREGSRDVAITRGSRALAELASEEEWQIEGVAVLESIAYAGTSVPQKTPAGLPGNFPKVGDFIAIVGNEDSAGLVAGLARAIEHYQIPLPFVPLVVPGRGEMFPDTRRSDHAPFWDHGYKAIMLTDTANFRNPHYHQPGDTLETLNLAFAAQVCRAVGGLVVNMAGWLDSRGV